MSMRAIVINGLGSLKTGRLRGRLVCSKRTAAKVFEFDDIRAHEELESNQSNGKMVVLV
jgi:hypothetical protein